jgi:hypothetical protein
MRAPGDRGTAADDVPVAKRLGRVALVMGAIAVAALIAVRGGVITLPGAGGTGGGGQSEAQASPAAVRMAADTRWAAATCTNILDWKNELHRDVTSLDLGFGPVARINDAITATTRMLDQLGSLGLPPAAQSPQARADANELRAGLATRLGDLRSAASGVASGNLAAVGTLLGELANEQALGTQLVNEFRHIVSVDLGLSLVETRACRQLVGIPI